MPLSPDDLARYVALVQTHAEHPIRLDMNLAHLAVVIGAVQLALRHPAFPAQSRTLLEHWVEQTCTGLGTLSPELAVGLRAGNDPANDLPSLPAPGLVIRMLPTEQLVTLEGELCRVWEGQTDEGVPCKVFVRRVAVDSTQDTEAFARTLEEALPPGRVVDLRQVLEE